MPNPNTRLARGLDVLVLVGAGLVNTVLAPADAALVLAPGTPAQGGDLAARMAWVAAHAHEIELFHLPAYAPEHNPDEYLNSDLKQKLRQQLQPVTQGELIKSTRALLRAIQRSPRRIQGYFKPPAVRYAA